MRPPIPRNGPLTISSDNVVPYKLDGLLFNVTLRPLPEGTHVYDMVLRCWVDDGDLDVLANTHRRRGVYAAKKRQLNTKEIRRLAAAVPAPSEPANGLWRFLPEGR